MLDQAIAYISDLSLQPVDTLAGLALAILGGAVATLRALRWGASGAQAGYQASLWAIAGLLRCLRAPEPSVLCRWMLDQLDDDAPVYMPMAGKKAQQRERCLQAGEALLLFRECALIGVAVRPNIEPTAASGANALEALNRREQGMVQRKAKETRKRADELARAMLKEDLLAAISKHNSIPGVRLVR